MSDPVAAVSEAAATGEVAAIFADIRAVYRVGVVNLVWRHLATIPGGLPYVWGLLRPCYLDGSVAREAGLLRAGLALPLLPVLPEAVLRAAGLSVADIAAARGVMAAYHRTNAMALVALTAARQHLAGAPRQPAPGGGGPADEAAVALPELPALESLPPAVAALVLALNRFGADRVAPLLASMYRHLAHWPPVLALSWTLLAPAGGVVAAAQSALAASRRHAARLDLPGLPVPAAAPAIDAAIARFTEDPILRMTVVCAMLARAFGAAGAD